MKDGFVNKIRSTIAEDQSSVPNTYISWLQTSVTLTPADLITHIHTHTNICFDTHTYKYLKVIEFIVILFNDKSNEINKKSQYS